MRKALHRGLCMIAAALTAAPAAAALKSAPAPTAVSADGVSAAAVASDRKYCVREAINSRILRSYCRTAKEWEDAGSPVEGWN